MAVPAGGSFVTDMIRPLAVLMPALRRADRAVPFRRRMLYTGLSLSAFMACTHLPLYGVRYPATATGTDPLYWVRSILASHRGTIMELGVGPVLTAGTVVQLLIASKAKQIRVGQNDVRRDRDRDRDLMVMDGAQKVLAVTIALGEAAAYVLLGMYGPVGALSSALIVLQLLSASVLVVFLSELFDKGYCLKGCSGIYLFSATNTCGKAIWQAFSPVTVNTRRGPEFEGIVLAVIHQAVSGAGNPRALVATMFRGRLPNMVNLLATCHVLLTAVYLEGIWMQLPLQPRERHHGRRHVFVLKLLYTSTMPIMLYSAMVSNLYMVSQLLHYSRFGGGVLGRLLGVWKWKDASYAYAAVPVGGLAYYVTPPSRSSLAADPLHALIYTVLLLTSCALLSQFWVIASLSSARGVARQLHQHGLAMPGGRDGDTYSQLKRYVPTAAIVGGLCVGALSIFADMAGALGTGTGIMLAASIIYKLTR